jgi:hypothetical protein
VFVVYPVLWMLCTNIHKCILAWDESVHVVYTIKRNIASMIVTVVKALILTTFLIVDNLCFSTPVTRVSTFCIVYYVRNLLLFCKSPDTQLNS